MSVFIDLTELLKNPVLSGIQRVTAQLCRHWPTGGLVPVQFVEGSGLVALDRRLVSAIASHFDRPNLAAGEFTSLFGLDGCTLRLSAEDTVLVPELFYDRARIAFYEAIPGRDLERYRFIIYDLKPIEYPEYFPNMPMDIICAYFRMIRRVVHRGFISEATRQAFHRRLLRSPNIDGVVLRLGSDGLGPRPTTVAHNRPLKFTVIGRVELSKNPGLIVEAFEPLLSEIPGLKLVFIGKLGHVEPALEKKLRRMSADPSSGLEHHSQPDDEMIRRQVDESRATVFLSGAEGFGLPPVESLWRGIPVIVSPGIPSLETIGSAGLHVVNPLESWNVRQAVEAFCDEGYARKRSEEALALDLPTWRGFTRQVAEWCRPA